MSKSKTTEEKEYFKKRNQELNKLRTKIIEAIRFSENYWMTFRNNTFGVARIIDLTYKQSYIEILFYPKIDAEKFSKPLIEIESPIETAINFEEIISKPDIDKDGIVNPLKTIDKIEILFEKELKNRLTILEKEFQLIDEKFENYMIENAIFNREIRIIISDRVFQLNVNFEYYPLLIPIFSFSKSLNRIIKLKDFLNNEIITNWDKKKPPHIVDILDKLILIILKKLKLDSLPSNSQHLALNNVNISNELKNISFEIHKGKSLGIYYEQDFSLNTLKKSDIMNLYRAIEGSFQNFRGKITFFGKNVKDLREKQRDNFKIISPPFDPKLESMSVRRAIKYKQRIKVQKSSINSILELVNLSKKKGEKVAFLSLIDKVLFYISRAIITLPDIIMISLPTLRTEKLEYDKFNKYLKTIKKTFHIVLIIHGPKEIISECNQILTITKLSTNLGSLEEYISKIPQSGEYITVELFNPDPDSINKLKKIHSVRIVEVREHERYKIYSEVNPKEMINDLINLLGDNLYSFKRDKATLGDYIELYKNT